MKNLMLVILILFSGVLWSQQGDKPEIEIKKLPKSKNRNITVKKHFEEKINNNQQRDFLANRISEERSIERLARDVSVLQIQYSLHYVIVIVISTIVPVIVGLFFVGVFLLYRRFQKFRIRNEGKKNGTSTKMVLPNSNKEESHKKHTKHNKRKDKSQSQKKKKHITRKKETHEKQTNISVKNLKNIVNEFESIHYKHKPRVFKRDDNVGFGTATGKVAKENQDAICGFSINERTVIVIADGCGGHDYGREASLCAVYGASTSIIRSYATGIEYLASHTEAVIASAIESAISEIVVCANIKGLKKNEQGLRTTLIVLIADKDSYTLGYCGDGGACILRENGEIENMLQPQKQEGTQNILTSTLGAEMMGQPEILRMERQAGDLVLAGTDGIFDRVNMQSFPKNVRDELIYQKNAQKTVDDIISEVVSRRDETGYIFNDNVTFALMADEKFMRGRR